MPRVYIQFPRVGLGNMMLLWARGILFAKLNNLPVVTSSWWGLHYGALLRMENRNRLYFKYFVETPYWKRLIEKFIYKIQQKKFDPDVVEYKHQDLIKYAIYIFRTVDTNNELFKELREHHLLIKNELYKIIHPRINRIVLNYPPPIISVHIRRGDFKIANQITSISYFVNGIKLIRSTLGKNLPVTVFSDAEKNEIEEILMLDNVFLAEKKPDIADIILMSKSKIIMLSRSSTFSYWAAFLSDALVIMPFDDWQLQIRGNGATSNYKEIKWNSTDSNSSNLLKEALKLGAFY